jgi:hypothetical protein
MLINLENNINQIKAQLRKLRQRAATLAGLVPHALENWPKSRLTVMRKLIDLMKPYPLKTRLRAR